MRKLVRLLPLVCCLATAGSQLGDAGHYLTRRPEVSVLNPDGREWSFTVHRFAWWIGHGWNRPDLAITVTGPDGETVVHETRDTPDRTTVAIPAGPAGVYRIDVDTHSGLNFWYMECSLDHSVVAVHPKTDDYKVTPVFCFNPFVPRTWYFRVPTGTERFRIRAINPRGRSHREDHGITVISPRGQRQAVLWGQANPDSPPQPVGPEQRPEQTAEIIVEPGSADRFWAIEVRHGDSHTYSDINVILEGVPPYLATRPESWFDPMTGTVPPIPVYDRSHFVQSDKDETAQACPIKHWTPCPAIGDPDADEIRTPARVALWNPDGEALKLVIGTYLPRDMFPTPEMKAAASPEALPRAQVAASRDGQALFSENVPLHHLHHGSRWERRLDGAPGVLTFDITDAEHFWLYTYPATPAVLCGRDLGAGWYRFDMEIGTARNWYFRVPDGTEHFSVRFAADAATDVLDLEVRAPDRTVAAVYAGQGAMNVVVPPGLDDCIWHLRLDVGQATRFATDLAHPRFPSIAVALDLRGVPPCLAPTWEQWFDPAALSARQGFATTNQK